MITTIKQARAVQNRRVDAGRFGYAKAVRRFVARENGLGVEGYYALRNSLPVAWGELREAA